MSDHHYTFDGNIRRKTDGGSNGVDLTGEIARNVMSWWDIIFVKLVGKLGVSLEMYKQHVDVSLEAPINVGWDYCTRLKKLGYNDNVTDNDSPCVRTAKELQKIANSIYREIQMTYDTPALRENGRLPILDLAVWIENNNIYHSFYKKDVSSRHTEMKRSAMQVSVKHHACFQECVRGFLNVSPGLPWKESVRHLNDYSVSLYESGYNQKERFELIKGTIMSGDIKEWSSQ